MTESTIEPEIHGYYERGGERDRLAVSGPGRLEFLRTRDILRRVLPTGPLSILDVGGAYGVHARWLAEDGHRVHLVDPVPSQVTHAATLPGVHATVGDARRLDVPDDHVDATLLLGPLYHLVDAGDRHAALVEALRVTRPGGLVAVATISRFAGRLDLLSRHALGAHPGMAAALADVERTGVHAPAAYGAFTTAYFHRCEEIALECARAGLDEVRQYAIEGAAWLVSGIDTDLDDDNVRELVLDGLRRTETEPSMLGVSSHLLTIGTVD
ncbi:class I SAM-dependent methyltransferase [Stackebrandtia soli]|uniref:class I SAM-dependent methyltransferase n=1 Tax=Stackebrandtia soli TaxID=1892856 RepID=UPI0039EBD53B